jgi:hypothetical protein
MTTATLKFCRGEHCEILYVNKGTKKNPSTGVAEWRRIVVEEVYATYIVAKDKDKGEKFRSFRFDQIQDYKNYRVGLSREGRHDL